MRKKYFITIAILLALTGCAFSVSAVLASNPLDSDLVNSIANGAGYNTDVEPETAFTEALGTVVGMLLSLLGIVFIVLIMYGGYTWMMARGNESEVEKAKHTIRDAIIGIIVLTASYGIWLTIRTILLGMPSGSSGWENF